LPNLELNTLVFLERAIAASLDLGVVDEEVLRAVVRGDVPKTSNFPKTVVAAG
jgi:hypothetical protein